MSKDNIINFGMELLYECNKKFIIIISFCTYFYYLQLFPYQGFDFMWHYLCASVIDFGKNMIGYKDRL